MSELIKNRTNQQNREVLINFLIDRRFLLIKKKLRNENFDVFQFQILQFHVY